jgi:hypothetical protein
LYSFEFGFVTLFIKHEWIMSCTRHVIYLFSNEKSLELYKACSFESGSENSFERMWCIPNGFYITGRRSFSETWMIGDV